MPQSRVLEWSVGISLDPRRLQQQQQQQGEERPCASEKRYSRAEQSGVEISLEATAAAAGGWRSCQGRRDRSRESQPLCWFLLFNCFLHFITLHAVTLHYITCCITLVKRFVAFVAVFSFSITSFPHPVPSTISPQTVTSSSNLFCWFFSVGSTFCSTVSMLQHVKIVTDPSETILISDQS